MCNKEKGFQDWKEVVIVRQEFIEILEYHYLIKINQAIIF
jgi:hypothetical protein